MMKYTSLLHLAVCMATMTFGQKPGDYYIPVSSDSIHKGEQLKFINDSAIELSSIPHHMNPSVAAVYKYKSTDSTIQIFPRMLTSLDSHPYSWQMHTFTLTAKINLTKIKGGFIDYERSLIYIKEGDVDQNQHITYIIDGKTFIQDMGVSNGYGAITRMPKINRALQRKLKNIDPNNYAIEMLRGLNAYKRFGIKTIYGVIIFTSKK